MYLTNETNGHVHTIGDPKSGFTDPGPDGHRHKLNIPGCASCRAARKKIVNAAERILKKSLYPTSWDRGHLHYFSSEVIDGK